MSVKFLPRLAGAGMLCLAALLAGPAARARPDAARPLSLVEAQRLALDAEPGERAVRARAEALHAQAEAADQLPDPEARLGFLNLPNDSFALDREAMTQVQLGLRQRFPAAGSLDARSAAIEARAKGMEARAALRRRQVLLSVRKAWLNLWYWQEAERVVQTNRRRFADLVEISRSLYAQGYRNQQDVMRAELELSRLDDRLEHIAEELGTARASLGQWIGAEAAARPAAARLPDWSAPTANALQTGLEQHPVLRMVRREQQVADAGVDAAEAAYHPSWTLDVAYGKRYGEDPSGAPRSNLVSVMASVSLPIFTSSRQDPALAAAQRARVAVEFEQRRVQLELREQLDSARTRWETLRRRIALFGGIILEQAEQQADASREAYQNDRGDFADLMRAEITLLDLRLQLQELRSEQAKARAMLYYLGGNDHA